MNTQEPNLVSAFLSHQTELRQFLLHRVNCNETAEDLLQETYLRIALYNADTVLNQRAFLYRVAGNLALDYLRSQARREQWDSGWLTEDIVCTQPQPEGVLLGWQRMEQFKRLLIELPPDCREVFWLCRMEGKAYRQVAEELDMSLRHVEHLMYQAVKKLKSDNMRT